MSELLGEWVGELERERERIEWVLSGWVSEQVIKWMNEGERVNEWLRVRELVSNQVGEWTIEWVSEWMSERERERESEWVSYQ